MIGVGVQLPLLTTSEIVVEAVRPPETPLTVMLYVPAAAVLDAVKVSTLVLVAGFVPKDAVTPAGKPAEDRVTLLLNPPEPVTVMVSVAVLPCVIGTVEAEDVRLKPEAEPAVMTNVWLLLQKLGFTYVATKVLEPEFNGIPLISRWLELNPAGPVQVHFPLSGCGPRFTLDPTATVAVVAPCHAPPFTCRYGMIGVGVHLALLTSREIVVEPVRLLETPLTLTL